MIIPLYSLAGKVEFTHHVALQTMEQLLAPLCKRYGWPLALPIDHFPSSKQALVVLQANEILGVTANLTLYVEDDGIVGFSLSIASGIAHGDLPVIKRLATNLDAYARPGSFALQVAQPQEFKDCVRWIGFGNRSIAQLHEQTRAFASSMELLKCAGVEGDVVAAVQNIAKKNMEIFL